MRRVLRQMAPALLGVSVAQLSVLINTQIATHQGVGAVSWLVYADRLMEFPTALLGVAVGFGADPAAGSAAQGRGDAAAYSGLLDWGLRLALVLALPCAVGSARLSRCASSRRCSSTASFDAVAVSQDGARRCRATAPACSA